MSTKQTTEESQGATPMADETFECPICYSDLTLDVRVLVGDGDDAICRDCLVDQFKQDLKRSDAENETEFGVRWGLNTTLHAKDFPDLFDAEFIADYEHASLQFSTPRAQRVYCPHGDEAGSGDVQYCGAFVTTATPTKEVVACPVCDGMGCRTCREAMPSANGEHDCAGAPEAEPEDEVDVSELRQGKDYQNCPGCKTVYQLRDACNYVRCALNSCGKGFCYICGVETGHDSDHWSRAKPCPRWGHPDDRALSAPFAKVDMNIFKLHLERHYVTLGDGMKFPRWIKQITGGEWYVIVDWRPEPGPKRFASAQVWGGGMHNFNEVAAARDVIAMEHLRGHFASHPGRLSSVMLAIQASGGVELVEQPDNFLSPRPLKDFREGMTMPPWPQLDIMRVFVILQEIAQAAGGELGEWSRQIRRDVVLTVHVVDHGAEFVHWRSQGRHQQLIPLAEFAAYDLLEQTLMSDNGKLMDAVCRDYKRVAAYPAARSLQGGLSYTYMLASAKMVDLWISISSMEQEELLTKAEGDAEKERLRTLARLPPGMMWFYPTTKILFRYLRDGQAIVPFERAEMCGFYMPDHRSAPTDDDERRREEAEGLLVFAAWTRCPDTMSLPVLLARLEKNDSVLRIGSVQPYPTLENVDEWIQPGYHRIDFYPERKLITLEAFGRDDSKFLILAKLVDDDDPHSIFRLTQEYRIIDGIGQHSGPA